MRRMVLVAAFALPLAFGAAGCRHANSPRQVDDLLVQVELGRGFVRQHTEYEPKDLDFADEIVGGGLEQSAGFAGALFCLVIVAPVAYGLERTVERTQATEGYIWPKERAGYQQRLYWGQNKVYLPRECADRLVPLVVEFRGNYAGTYEFEVDLSRHRETVRLR